MCRVVQRLRLPTPGVLYMTFHKMNGRVERRLEGQTTDGTIDDPMASGGALPPASRLRRLLRTLALRPRRRR